MSVRRSPGTCRLVRRWRREGIRERIVGKVYDEASTVTAAKGEVQVDGPDGVAVSMTPDAAAETSDRLLAGASQAMGQKLEVQRLEEERRRLSKGHARP